MKEFRTLRRVLLPLLFVLAILTGCSQAESGTDYSKLENWAYFDAETEGRDADVFFICPSVYGGSDDACNMSLSDQETKESFFGAINMEKESMTRTAVFLLPTTARLG